MREDEKLKEREDAAVDVSMSDVMTLGDAAHSKTPRKSAGASLITEGQDADFNADSDEQSEVDAQEERLHEKKGKGRKKDAVKAFEQRDLVARAFAGDNVVREFAEEKGREVESDAPKEVDMTLAGWVRLLHILLMCVLTIFSRFSSNRARGVAWASKKRQRLNRISSRSSQEWTPSPERTMARRTSSSLRNGTRRLRSTLSRTCHIRIRQRCSSRGVWTRQSAANGTRGSGSRGVRCRRLLKR